MTRPRHPLRFLLAGASLLAVLAVLAAVALPAQQTETFSEEVFVREVELVVDLPDILEDNNLRPRDFRVLVDGQPREVTRVEPVADADLPAPWTVVVYVDQVLAAPGTVFYAGLSLAERARELTALGSVEVVVAGSDPRVVLAATREAKRVEEVLAGLAGEARVARDRAAEAAGPAAPPAAVPLNRQFEKLLAFAADRRPSGPHALFLIADGIEVTPEQAELLEGEQTGEPPPGSAAATFRGAARLLAAYGWVTIPVPLRKEAARLDMSGPSDSQVFRQHTNVGGSNRNGPPPVAQFRGRKPSPLDFAEVIDIFIMPQMAALRTLARATAGTVIGYEVQLDAVLDALSRRWRVWYAAPETVDGQVRPIELRLLRTDLLRKQRKKEVRAPAWVRSSTPEGIAEVRLRNLLAGAAPPGGLPLTVTADEVPAGLAVRFQVTPFQVANPTPPGPLRISYAFSRDDGSIEFRHELVTAADLPDRGWSHAARLAFPAGTRQVAVTVDDLSSERWSGAVLPTGELRKGVTPER